MTVLPSALIHVALQESATSIMLLDSEQCIVFWNKRLEQTSLISANNAVGKQFVEVFPNLLNSRIHHAIKSCLSSGFPAFLSQPLNVSLFPLYMPSTTKQKTPMQQQVQFIPLNIGQELRYCMVQIIDISALIARERLLKSKEKEFRAMFELAASGHALVDPQNGQFLRINRKLCEMLGYSEEELLQQTFFAITFPDDSLSIKTAFSKLVDNNCSEFSSNLRCLHKNGELLWVYISITLGAEIKQSEQKLAIMVLQDITELKTIEDRLRVTQFTLDNVRVAICWINQYGNIKYANDEASRRSGLSLEQLQVSSLFDLDKSYTSVQWCNDWEYVKTQGSVNFEYTIKNQDNQQYPVDITANYLKYGNQEFVCAFVHDIAERKKYELALQKAKEAAEANNRSKSVFLSNMSHELRTPLNAILGFSQLMERDPELKSSHQNHLAIINSSGQHLLSLINDVLEISRIESGRLTIELETFDLIVALKELKNMINVRAESKGLTLILTYENLPKFVRADVHHLRQVLLNLLSNAVKYTESGSVTLKVQHIQDQQFQFSVIDTGPGIPLEDRERIFDTFYQTNIGVQKGEGTGLGLAISREYVHLMGGTLSVTDNPKGGSIFSFTIPLLSSDETTSTFKHNKKIISLKHGIISPRVLVVEDDNYSRELIATLLKNTGINTRTAENGQIALEIYQQWHPQFIWMDMRMPVMDGYEATRRIRALRDNHVTIVALTASAFLEDRKLMLDAGCDEVLTKPLQTEKIFEVMQRFLDIEFDYDQDKISSTAIKVSKYCLDLSLLSTEQQQQLRDSALRLDQDEVQHFINSIQQQHTEIAQELKRLLDNFRFDQIIALCEAQLASSIS